MTQKQYKITLLFGIIGAVLTVLGDFLIGANPAGGSEMGTLWMFSMMLGTFRTKH